MLLVLPVIIVNIALFSSFRKQLKTSVKVLLFGDGANFSPYLLMIHQTAIIDISYWGKNVLFLQTFLSYLMCRRAVGAWGCKDGQNHPGRWRETEGGGEECWETNRGLSERAKISHSQMNHSRIMKLTRVAALMCVGLSASVRSESTSLSSAVLLYLQSIIPNITNGGWWRQKEANANMTDKWRRRESSQGVVWLIWQ